jgi:hypothetical protein
MALRIQTKNLRRLSIFQECFRSSLDCVVNLYALGDDFVLTINGPSHFGSSLPRDSVRVVRTSTRSPSLNSLGNDCVVAPGLRLGLIFVEGLQGEDTVSVNEVFGSWLVDVGYC